MPLERGHVILLGFGVQQRARPHPTFKLPFDALHYATPACTASAETAAALAGRYGGE